MIEVAHQKSSGWNAIRLKWIFTDYFGGSWGDDLSVTDPKNLVRVVRVSEFDMNRLRIVDEIPTIRSLELDASSRKLLKKNDVVLEKSGGGEKTPVGRSVLFDKDPEFPTINSNFTNLFRPDLEKVDPGFLVYSLFSSYLLGQTARNIKQTTGIQNLDVDEYLAEMILLPPLDEQRLISRYLDKKTQQIDTLIEKIEKKIELLKEQRTSLINHNVTKGLDPNVEMKDSGVEWIGKIPKHWNLSKLKFVASIQNGSTPKSDVDAYWDGTIRWFTPSDFKHRSSDGSLNEPERWITELGLEESGCSLVTSDSVLLTTRAPVGNVAKIKGGSTFNQGCKAITPSNIDLGYLFRLMGICGELLDSLSNGTTFKELPTDRLSSVTLPVPPLNEQREIARCIDDVTQRLGMLTERETRRVRLLAEYRQSLISSVVTGNIRVTEEMV